MTPGRLLYLGFHRPLAALRQSWREGGPWEQWKTERGRREMVRHASLLPPVPAKSSAETFVVHMLTGRRFWYQSAFCLHSLATFTPGRVVAHLYDDGSLDEPSLAGLQRLGIEVQLHRASTIEQWLAARLPADRFPTLRQRWLDYPIIRKLIAPHLRPGATGWQLVIDSDLLFFREPRFLLDWLRAPDRPFHAVDVETNYGYSRPLLDSLAPAPLAERVNAGLYGLKTGELDWAHVESIASRLFAAEGTHYFLEQALLATLVAGRSCAVAPAPDYVTLPRPPEAEACRAVMHHYVADSKRWYFRHCWKVAWSRPAP
jgi:hypothetical protein